jgi:predicted AAA+ superfamily ATPase
MLYRKIYEKLKKHKAAQAKKALLITGARQVGKTYAVRQFGRENYDHFVELNFISEPRAAEIFQGNLSAETLIASLTGYRRAPLPPGKTLVFIDEIQECPNARTAIKFLVDDGRFDYIESGSLLGVNYKEVKSYPVGYEEKLEMFPLDFEEFVLALGVQEKTIETLRENFTSGKPVNEAIHQNFLELFRYYVLVGGLPEAVKTFADKHDVSEVLKIQRDILDLYRQDITKYDLKDKMKIKSIFDRLPNELNSLN